MDNDSGAVVPVQKKQFKIVLIGNAKVGKTSFLKKYFFNSFSSNYNATLVADTHQDNANGKLIEVSGNSLEENDLFFKMYIDRTGAVDAFLVFYDITNRASFDQISAIVHKIRSQYPDNTPPIILVGTKSDLVTERKVSKEEANALNEKLHCNGAFEVSSATGENVKAVMTEINRQMIERVNPSKEKIKEKKEKSKEVKNPKEQFVIDYEKLRELDYIWNTTPGNDKKAKILAILKDYTKFNYCCVGQFFATLGRNHVGIINTIISNGQHLTVNKSAQDLLNDLNQRLQDSHLTNASGLAAHIKYFINEKMNNRNIVYPAPAAVLTAENSTETMDAATRSLSLR